MVLFLSILGSEVPVILFWTGVNCRAYHFPFLPYMTRNIMKRDLMAEVNIWPVSFTVRPPIPR